jgi:hypothetical protein
MHIETACAGNTMGPDGDVADSQTGMGRVQNTNVVGGLLTTPHTVSLAGMFGCQGREQLAPTNGSSQAELLAH